MIEYLSLLMFAVTFLVLVAGYPVAATLAGVGLLFAFIGIIFGIFDATILGFIPSRVFGIVTNQTLIAVPLFVLMGITLERTEIAKTLLESMSRLFSKFPGGLGLAVIIVGMLMAASTGIVGATVVTMGLLALPTLLEKGYDPKLATGTIAATGTLGQIIPPSIALVLLGDVLSNAYQQAQLQQGVFAPKTVSVGDLFAGALIPGIVLVAMYSLFMFFQTTRQKHNSVAVEKTRPKGNSYGLIKGFAPPFILIISVLGSILFGYATPTEAAALGAIGSLFLAALSRNLSFSILHEISQSTMRTTAMVFFILLGASIFSLVFRGFGGDDLVQSFFADMPGGVWGAVAVVMVVIFFLGFILDFIEITYVVVPIVGPSLMALGVDPIWLGVLIAVNLQTSFLTPPFGFALFYLRGVAPQSISTKTIYRGVMPFVTLQLCLLGFLCLWPKLATWLPSVL
ncbi:MAG TPA: C4-dicarboxylate ABC transporter [Gammaproteobacteria bacterium]|nr:C4-dicarboxylate ABC transporter [Gammaproteobacteria bacterium]|tara:strand:+ start:69 stop:1433 length:1365 start_codon:yes stop_codon:yes gene_type:complete